MFINKKSLIVFSFIVCTSCIVPENRSSNVTEDIYFDIKKVIAPELERLQTKDPTVSKESMMDGEQKSSKGSVSDWEKELSIFLNADINKPILKGSYNISQKGNVTTYISEKKDLPIQKVDVTFQNDYPSLISITEEKSSALFQNKREMSLELEMGKLKRYSLMGYQKMPAKDSLVYKITATILD